MTRSTAVPRTRAWSGAATATLGATLVLLLQVGVSAWHGAALAVALLLVALGAASVDRVLRTTEDAVGSGPR